MQVYGIHIKRALFCVLGGFILALIIAKISPKVYEGRMQILVGANQAERPVDQLYPDVQEILNAANAKDTLSELDVLRGEGVFTQALQNVYRRQGHTASKEEADALFAQYDVVSAKDTSVGEVRARAHDPQMAADLANEVGVVYNELRKKAVLEAVRDARQYLARQEEDAKKNLDTSEAGLRALKEKYNVMDPVVKNSADTQTMAASTQLLDASMAQLKGAEAEVTALQNQLAGTPAKTVANSTSQTDPSLLQLRGQLQELFAKRDMAVAQYADNAPQVKELDRQIAGLQIRLRGFKKEMVPTGEGTADNPLYLSLRQNLATSIAHRDSLRMQVQQLQSQMMQKAAGVGELPKIEAELKRLTTEEQLADMKYRSVKEQAERLKFKTEGAARAAQILFLAQPDDSPVAPSFPRLAIIGMVAGAMVGLLFSYLLESTRLRVYNSTQLTELTGLPVVASVPTLPRPLLRRLTRSLPTENAAVLESFRFMAFSTLSGEKGTRAKSLLLTGVGGDVGTTTTAAQYAIAAARTGARVLLVDFDLQYATLSRIFGMADKTGVREILNTTTLAYQGQVGVATNQQNLVLLPAGNDISLRAADVPYDRLCALVTLLEGQADLVVIDAPAIDRLSDAARLVPCVDGVCLVVSANSTNYRHILLAQDILAKSGAKDVSLVLTGASNQDEPFTADTSSLIERA